MSREIVNSIAGAMPGAECSYPFGDEHDVWKVGGKIFAVIGLGSSGVIVKCRDVETAAMLIEVGAGAKAPYFHHSWVMLPFGATAEDEFRYRIESSYALIRSKLPKKVQAGLG